MPWNSPCDLKSTTHFSCTSHSKRCHGPWNCAMNTVQYSLACRNRAAIPLSTKTTLQCRGRGGKGSNVVGPIMLNLIPHHAAELRSKGYPLSPLGEAWWTHTGCILAFLLQQTEGWCEQAFVHGIAQGRKRKGRGERRKCCYHADLVLFLFTADYYNNSAHKIKAKVTVGLMAKLHMPKYKIYANCIR